MSTFAPPTSDLASRLDRQVPAVEVRDLRKTFRRRDRKAGRFARKRPWPALADVSFTIARGECVAILGQNGSGKSTLVRLLSTLLIDDGGEARVFGHDIVKDASAIRRLVNRVSVEASFFKKMSAFENLSYAARFYGMTPSQTRKAIPEILAQVGFPPDRSGEAMENLSRGMQQKVALARALLTSPVLLLLDEPTTGLDPRSKLEVQEFIRQVRAEHDATILLCTHDMAEAETLADRIGLLDRGRLLFLEPVADVKRRFGVETLEEAFFAATGREFVAEEGDASRTTTSTGRCSDERVRPGNQESARRPVRDRRAQRLSHQALLPLGSRVHGLDDREHAHDRLHRARDTRHLGGGGEHAATALLIGATIWAFLGIIFEFMTETVAWERWEGTIEYTFMAPLSRLVHLFGQGAYAVLYGLIRATILFFVVAAFIGIHAPHANYAAALGLLALASLSFIGVGIMTSVLPLISPEKGAQLGFVCQGIMLVVSGVYYPVQRHAGVDAVDLEDLAGDVRAARLPGLDHQRNRHGVGRRLAAADHRRPRDADRARRLPRRRAAREAAREAEAGGMTDWFAGKVAERYDSSTADMPIEPVVDFLEPLAGGGALELAIGTGRIAVPLAAPRRAGRRHRPLAGHGRAAASEDGRDPGGDRRHGDDASRGDVLARLRRLQLDQQRHDAGRAGRRVRERGAHLAPGGCFVVEVGVHNTAAARGVRPERHPRRRRRARLRHAAARLAPLLARRRTVEAGCRCRSAPSRRRSST